MTSYEHKVKNIYLWSPYNEWQPLIPGDYTLLRWPCDEWFHVPLKEEWNAIINISISVANAKSSLHIPIMWRLNNEWTKENTGRWYYWSSNATTFQIYVYYLYSWNTSYTSVNRSLWIPIRAFRNNPIIPDSSWRETITGKAWYNSDLWLISILVWTNQYITMQDKNIWATEVYEYWNALSESNCGKYFQRWNDYWFPYTWPTTESPTKVDTSNYWPTNHYNSDTFINWSTDWSSVQNDNLRWYTDFNS